MSSFNTPLTAYNPEQVGGETTSNGSVWLFVTSDSDSRNNSTVISTGVAQMNAMLVYWQESDLEKFDTGYASELAEALLPSNTFAPSVTTTAGTILGLQSGTAVPPDRSQLVVRLRDGARSHCAHEIRLSSSAFLLFNERFPARPRISAYPALSTSSRGTP